MKSIKCIRLSRCRLVACVPRDLFSKHVVPVRWMVSNSQDSMPLHADHDDDAAKKARLAPKEKNNGQTGGQITESTIRLMTRLAIQHGAVNLSQGFPNEPPPPEMALTAAGALLGGSSPEAALAMAANLQAFLAAQHPGEESEVGSKDLLSQYSFPFGLPMLRTELQRYYKRFYPGLEADAEKNLTVVLGATEGFACSLRTLCEPGDSVVFFEPFHELYPSQCKLWHLKPVAVTLREDTTAGEWRFEEAELEAALIGAKVLLLNTPHNPTGKVFSYAELEAIAKLCVKHDVVCVTDEIYEHIVFDGLKHHAIALCPGMAERTLIVNAISKTARATGWRVGWVVSPARYTAALRGVHDQLVLQAPTPLQFGAAALLKLPDSFFAGHCAEYAAKRDVLMHAITGAGFIVTAVPHGAYYLFADYRSVPALQGLSPTEAAMKMTKDVGVACVPGDNFYLGSSRTDPELGGRYLRFAFVRSLDLLEAAAVRLREKLETG